MSDSTKTQFVEVLTKHLKYLPVGETIDFNKKLKSLGLDSMASVDLIFDLEDEFEIVLPDQYLTEETFSTAESLWSVINTLARK